MKRHAQDLLMQASEMWKAGKSWKEIAPVLNVKKRRFSELCSRRRDLFPTRARPIESYDFEAAARMWKDGLPMAKIRAALGIPKEQLVRAISDNPDLFPKRVTSGNKITFVEEQTVPIRVPREDTMPWLTIDGAVVTLPKISFIECPRVIA